MEQLKPYTDEEIKNGDFSAMDQLYRCGRWDTIEIATKCTRLSHIHNGLAWPPEDDFKETAIYDDYYGAACVAADGALSMVAKLLGFDGPALRSLIMDLPHGFQDSATPAISMGEFHLLLKQKRAEIDYAFGESNPDAATPA